MDEVERGYLADKKGLFSRKKVKSVGKRKKKA